MERTTGQGFLLNRCGAQWLVGIILMLALLGWTSGGTVLHAQKTQPRPSYLDSEAELRVVGQLQRGKTYPLMVFLPFTTSNAETFFGWVSDVQPVDTYIALIPKGTTQREHYLPDFMAFIKWYETRLLADIERAKKLYPIDTKKIFLQGFSLGGDLGWALMIRQREMFAGAVMFGTRTSYGATKAELERLRVLDRRFWFGIGRSDDADRRSGMEKAYKLVQGAKIGAVMETFDGGHSFPTDEAYWMRVWNHVFPPARR